MKTILALGSFLFILGAGSLRGQELLMKQDFLTDHEADLIRVAQDPNDRIKQYLHFAQLRLELAKQALSAKKPGRSQLIHRNLEQYGRIVETIDLVIDDGLARKIDVTKGIAAAAEQEKLFLADLERIAENPADDHERYEFVLEDAIEITRDSIELAAEDLGDRARSILEADARREKKRLESMTPALREEVSKEKQAEQQKEAERERKRPTLLKPGETTGGKP